MLKSIVNYHRRLLLVVFILLVLSAQTTTAQTTAFTYEGKLNYLGQPANGNFDFEFRLYDAASGGSQLGETTIQRLNVVVNNGVYSVILDFGAMFFNGEDRFLEIGSHPAGSAEPFTISLPRPQITSAPYSIRSLNATNADSATTATNATNAVNATTAQNALQLGGVAANQYVLTTDSRMTDTRNPSPNSPNYVQNTTVQQSSANFHISGNGTAGGTLSANAINATTQFNIGGSRILSKDGTANLFAGQFSGSNNTTGGYNSFFGNGAGNENTTGSYNSFFGRNAGKSNTTSNGNSFFGYYAGSENTTGSSNSYFGYQAGKANMIGSNNSFFGYNAGAANIGVTNFNSFFGSDAGSANINGNENSFFGAGAGAANTSGHDNSFFGRKAGGANTTGDANTFFGYQAGGSNTTGYSNGFFGYQAGGSNTTGSYNTFVGRNAGNTVTTGSNNTIIGYNADVRNEHGYLSFATAIGAGAVVEKSNTIALGRSQGQDEVRVPGHFTAVEGISVWGILNTHSSVKVFELATGGTTSVCRNSYNSLATCSSSLRYKTDVQPFISGLNLVRRLRPIAFTWKDGRMRDIGFGAEDVEKIEPLLVTYNAKGDIEGVKYAQITAVLVNAIKEQQAQIQQYKQQTVQQQEQLQSQQQELTVLKLWYCRTHPKAAMCRTAKPARR